MPQLTANDDLLMRGSQHRLEELAAATLYISNLLHGLREQYGVETMLIVTRGSITQTRFSAAYVSRKVSSFLHDVLRIDPGQLAERLEGYVISGASGDAGRGPIQAIRMKQKERIKIARDLVLTRLIDVLREQSIPEAQMPKSMNYKSYETRIVQQYGVVLVGYPGAKGVVNPGELDALTLKELVCRLNDGRCSWQKRNDMDRPEEDQKDVAPLGLSTEDSNCFPAYRSNPDPQFDIFPDPSTANASTSWQAGIKLLDSASDSSSLISEDDTDGQPSLEDFPSQTVPMIHHDPSNSGRTEGLTVTLPREAPDPVAWAMQAFYTTYPDTSILLSPIQHPHPTPLPLPPFIGAHDLPEAIVAGSHSDHEQSEAAFYPAAWPLTWHA